MAAGAQRIGCGRLELYDQEPEIELLAVLRPHLDEGTVLDVGAERGGLFHALRACGFGEGHLVEASPANVDELRRQVEGDPAVTLHSLAAGATDGEATVHLAEDERGEPMPAFNTARARSGGDGVRFATSVTVPRRSLASLVEEGLLPPASAS